MKKIKCTVRVDKTAAIMAGRAEYGEREIEIDPAKLNEEERKILADASEKYYLDYVGVGYSPNDCPIAPKLSGAETDEEIAHIVLAWRAEVMSWLEKDSAKKEIEKKEREEKEKIEKQQKIDDMVQRYIEAPVNALVEDTIAAVGATWGWQTENMLADPRTRKKQELVEQEKSRLKIEKQKQHEAEKIEEENKKQRRNEQIKNWVETHGTQNQQERYAAGLLPEDEAINGLRDLAFAPLGKLPKYQKIDADCLRHHDECEFGDVKFDIYDSAEASETQWETIKSIRAALPTATVTLREHCAKCDECFSELYRYSLKIEITDGEFNFSREYAI